MTPEPSQHAPRNSASASRCRAPRTPRWCAAQGRYTDDINLPNQAYAVIVRSTRTRTASSTAIDTDAAQGDAGRARGLHRRRPRRPTARSSAALPFKNRDGSDDEEAAAPGAGRPTRCASSAIRSPAWSPRRIAQAKDAAEADRGRHRAAARRHRRRAGGRQARRAAALRRRARTTSRSTSTTATPTRSPRRSPSAAHVRSSCTLINSRARRRTRWSRARRSANTTRPRSAARCTSCSQGVFGMKSQLRRHARRHADKVRVLTGNVGGSFGMKAAVYPEYVCILHAAQAARPPGEMDRRALRRASCPTITAATTSMTAELALDTDGHFLALRAHRLRQPRRLPGPMSRRMPPTLNIGARTSSASTARRCSRCRPSACSPTRRFVSALSRRRPPRGQLLHGAADRRRRRRDGHRPHRAAPPQPHHARARCPYKSRRPARTYDSGDFPALLQAGARSRRLRRASPSASARARSAASCAASASAAFSKSPRPPTRKWAASASTPTATSPSSPARSITARATPRRSRRC